MKAVHICRAKNTSTERMTLHCPYCEKEVDFLVETFQWYPSTLTCLNCGDEWQGDERSERPFVRGWRDKRIASAKSRLELAENVIDF